MSNRGVEDDIRYVRSVLDRAEQLGSPAGIYYLWAVLGFVGMSLVDFKPEVVGPYWAFAGPLGGAASFYLGWRGSRQLGQTSCREGAFHALHWIGMMTAIFLTIPLALTGLVSPEALPTLILLILAFGYYTAGIYLDRRLLAIGLLVGGCYLATIFVKSWPWIWTFTGAVLALGLVASGLRSRAVWRHMAAGDAP